MKVYILHSNYNYWGEPEGRGIFEVYHSKEIAGAERDRLNNLGAFDRDNKAKVKWDVAEQEVMSVPPPASESEDNWFVDFDEQNT